MHKVIEIDDIEVAIFQLGGTARIVDITKFLVNKLGSIPSNYKDFKTFQGTIAKKIEDHCEDSDNYEKSN